MPWSEVPFRFPWSPTLPSELAPDGVTVPVSAVESAGRRAWHTAVADESAPSGVGRAGHSVTGMSISTVDPPVARRVARRILQHMLPPRGARSTIGFARASRIRRSQRPFTLSVRLLRWCQNAGPVERGPATALRVRHLLPPWQGLPPWPGLRRGNCVAGMLGRVPRSRMHVGLGSRPDVEGHGVRWPRQTPCLVGRFLRSVVTRALIACPDR